MSSPRKRARNRLDEIVSLLVLGGGFVALFAGFEYFFLVWILGFVVLVPLVSILTGEEMLSSLEDDHDATATESEHTSASQETDDPTPSTQDALTTLRERYARGDLTDEQFDKKLTRLLETETPENAAEWRERIERETETETETETEW